MAPRNFYDNMNEVDSKCGDKAICRKKKGEKPAWAKWGMAAACFFAAVLAGIFALRVDDRSSVSVGGIARDYKDAAVMACGPAIEWPWEYKTIAEQYTTVHLNGKDYHSRGRPVDASFAAEMIGTFDAAGYDAYADQTHKITGAAYRIDGISEDHMVAVRLGEELYVFNNDEYAPPETLGEVLDQYALRKTLSLNEFTECRGYKENGFFRLDNDAYIWDVLGACRDAEFVEDGRWSERDRDYLSFIADSDALGVYKRVFNVTEDGYLSTNIFDYAYLFRIGREAARQIISYAVANGTESEAEPYHASLAGTLTEIADGYILINDAVLCSDEKDGMTFKVYLNDLRISRYIDFGGIDVGDTVVVYFTGSIDIDAGNVVEGAFSLSKGIICGGGASVPESLAD